MIIDDSGIAKRGLIIRHLILPNDLSGSYKVLKFITDKVSGNSYVNIMRQYTPYFKAASYKELIRSITEEEYSEVLNRARELGLLRAT